MSKDSQPSNLLSWSKHHWKRLFALVAAGASLGGLEAKHVRASTEVKPVVSSSYPRDTYQSEQTPTPPKPVWGAITSEADNEPRIIQTNITSEISGMNASGISLFYVQESNYPFLSRLEFWIGEEKVKLSLGDLVRLKDGIVIRNDQDDQSVFVFRPQKNSFSFRLDTGTVSIEVQLEDNTIHIQGEEFSGELDFSIAKLGVDEDLVRKSFDQEYGEGAWENQEPRSS